MAQATGIHKKVKFKDEEYWFTEFFWGYTIAPLHHWNEAGELLVSPLQIAFAIVHKGDTDICQFGEVIGQVSELEDVK